MKEGHHQNKSLIATAIGGAMVLLRTFIFTLFIQVIINAYVLQTKQTPSVTKAIGYIISSLAGFLLLCLTYISSQMFNLIVPNTILPWSETSPTPFLLECLNRIFITIAFMMKESTIAYYIFLELTLACLVYQMILRTTKSFFFNKTILKALVLLDTIKIYFLVFLNILIVIPQENLFYICLTLLVPIALATLFLMTKLRKGRFLKVIT